jgi:geranylgeranyl pyrophosphate synthase
MLGKDCLTENSPGLREKVETRLDALVPPADRQPPELHRSMRHTLLAPGKRVRALLTLFAANHFHGDDPRALDAACALEMVHAASLILDDLPAMDNASLRRGLPANHQIYGEATAMLAAIGLLSRAFGVIAEDETLNMAQRARLARVLSRAVGSEGLVAGQERDLKWSPESATREEVAFVHRHKTAALFAAAAEMGAVAAAADERQIGQMRAFGDRLGLAFQILDDLLDATANRETAGKEVMQDNGRPSLVLTIGREAAACEARQLIEQASALIAEGGRDETALGQFAMWLIAGLEARLRDASLGDE